MSLRRLPLSTSVVAGWLVAALLYASGALAVPVSQRLTVQTQTSVTTCVLNDGIGDYPLDLSDLVGTGCRWRKRVLIPETVRPTVTELRAAVSTDGYFGSWSVGLVDPLTDAVVGNSAVSLLVGDHESFGAPMGQVLTLGVG